MIINLGIHPFKVETTLPCIIFIGGKKNNLTLFQEGSESESEEEVKKKSKKSTKEKEVKEKDKKQKVSI